MDEQRIAAYLHLIQQFLECPNGEEDDILNANLELVDADFVQVMEAEAQKMAAEGNSKAGGLQNLAAQLANHVRNTATPEEYLSFVTEVLLATDESKVNPQIVYPILQQNLDKLDLKFAETLQTWATSIFTGDTSEQAKYIAGVIFSLGNLIQQFPLGRRAWNLEIGIRAYEQALTVYTFEALPQYWAAIKNNLGVAYGNRIKGDKGENIELALAAYEQALIVRTFEEFPQDWAITKNNLGESYRNRIKGDKGENIELAIAVYEQALTVLTFESLPQYWAMIQNNLGNAYSDRIKGDKGKNIELAIAAYKQALIVRTFEAFPQDWAMTQNNLAMAYWNRIKGDKGENIELAIAASEEALTVYTFEALPQSWAMTQNNLAMAYWKRIKGNKGENIELAIAAYKQALTVLTLEAFPQEWAITQTNLGEAYRNRIKGDKGENIELAIAAYKQALSVSTFEALPQSWAMTQTNLGNAYSDRIKGDKGENIELAIAAYKQALIVRTFEAFPQDWAITQHNLAMAYWKGDKGENIELAIAAYKQALIVLTFEAFPQDWAMTQNNLAMAYWKRIKGDKGENIELAIAVYKQALTVHTFEAFPQDWAMTQNNLGEAYRNRIKGDKGENIELAIACYRLALEIRTPTAFPLDCLQSGRNLGNTAFTAGFWDIALEGFEKAIQAVEKSRSWATSDNIRQQMIKESIDVYQKAIQAAVNNNQLEKAIECCDRTRAQRLVDLMHSNDLYAKGEIPPDVQKYLQEFEAKQREIDAEVEQLRKPSEGSKELASVGSQSRSRADLSAYTKKILELEGEKQQIWENIRSLDPVLAGQVQVDPMQFAAMQKLIDNSQTAILSFYTTDDDTHVFVIYKDKAPQVHTCQGEGWANFQQWIDKSWLWPYLVDNKSWQQGMGEFLSQLSQRLKVDELIGKYLDGLEELIMIPHLYLHQIPLAALPVSGNSFLGDKFLIRYVPSCQILEYCHQRPSIKLPQYGIVENATDDLYFTPFECEEINKIVKVKEHLKGRKQATVANYRGLVKTVNVLHSSHHAKSRLDNPLESELLLGNGALRLGELMTPGWRLPDLSDVFLSCCETNLGMTTITDDILTFGTGFLCAGARSAVSTLWEVKDLATSLFSIFYYQFRQQVGCSRPDALRRAQVRLRTISGAELEVMYKSQIDAIIPLIIENLKLKLVEVQAEKEKLTAQEKKYKMGTAEYKELHKQTREKTKEAAKICEKIQGYETLRQNLYKMPNPFADLIYWSGFICQGLH